jgi:hypothetical protein
MTTNRNTLTDAFNNKTLVSFIRGNMKETNVKIVKLQSDDVCNKEFTYETSKGERYSSFENNIEFV